jgi:two-component system cell cycle sensor histidine kinase/response regulator CckA
MGETVRTDPRPGEATDFRLRIEELAGQMFVSLVENSTDLIGIATLDGEVFYLNPAGREMLGLDDTTRPLRIKIQDFAKNEHLGKLEDLLVTLLNSGSWTGEMRAVNFRTGVPIPIETHAFLVRDPVTGTPIAMASISRDLSERKRTETALRVSEDKFSRAFRISPDSVNINRIKDGMYLEVNDGFCRATGYTPEEVVGRSSLELEIWARHEDRTTLLRRLREDGEVRNLEAGFRRKDGSILTGLMSAREIEVDGEPCILSITRDITERTRLEEQLRQAQKMEAVGRLAGGIAHDFNNLLTAIIGYSDVLLSRLQPEDPSAEELKAIQKAGESAAALTRQLLAFSRKQVLDLRPTSLNDLVTHLEGMLRRILGANVALETRLEPELWTVRADGNQIQQVLMNLAINARDAMPGGGTLAIRTRNALVESHRHSRPPDCPPGPYALLSVSDTGHGMDQDTARMIFEPFFTTKGVGKGTGLGLSMAHGIVRQSGGYIEVETAKNRGTTFHVYLPRVEEPARTGPAAPAPAQAKGGGETVLLAEDSDVVRCYISEILRLGGYAVLEASSGEAALQVAEDHRGPLDLLVTDMVMPGIGGSELASRLSASTPGLKILFISGYPEYAAGKHRLLKEGVPFLGKPFRAAVFLDKVREILDA